MAAGRVKVNIDAGLLGEIGIGIGVVARDSEGRILWCASIKRGEKLEPRLAEARAILVGMKLAAARGHDLVEFENDSECVVNAINKKVPGVSSFHLILDDIMEAAQLFSFCSWSWVQREGNKVAHELAHAPPFALGCKLWSDNFPDFLCNLLDSDCAA
ncbi:uncharacterized protein LOC110725378 [Chenopodium quinoa]|uniref:uncharacterized protein LOC110725378 n=1 Tax=Chenopodium quinoa TaxID=63459 RepID=UPI000B793E17|nr:uncharacterized protein LOC110725378 [Chenopodium quinoa]